jgi:hypothetical protein
MRRPITKDGAGFKILCALNKRGGMTSKEIKATLGLGTHLVDSTMCGIKKVGLVSQKKKFEPFFLTSKGASVLETFNVAINDKPIMSKTAKRLATEATKTASIGKHKYNKNKKHKKAGAPKNGKITNGVVHFSRPPSMSAVMFQELSHEHHVAEKRAEAIENLFHNWPR